LLSSGHIDTLTAYIAAQLPRLFNKIEPKGIRHGGCGNDRVHRFEPGHVLGGTLRGG